MLLHLPCYYNHCVVTTNYMCKHTCSIKLTEKNDINIMKEKQSFASNGFYKIGIENLEIVSKKNTGICI